MTKIVQIKNGFFAAGLNNLVQEIVDIGDCPGMIQDPVASPTLLPTNWNGLGAPQANTIGVVDQGAGGGIYRYQEAVDGLPFDHWLDSKASLNGVEYYRDTVEGAAARVSVLNGDTAADLLIPARNWLHDLQGGSVTDVGAGLTAAIRVTCDLIPGQKTSITFANAQWPPSGGLIIVAKLGFVGIPNGTSKGLGGYLEFSDATSGRRWRNSWNAHGQPNQLASVGLTPDSVLGPGYAHVSPLERMDFGGQAGKAYMTGGVLIDSGSGALPGVSFDRGFIPEETEIDTNFAQALFAAGNHVAIACESGPFPSFFYSMDVQELHVLRLL